MTEKIVIVGGVAAGPKAACRVKRLMPQAEVTLIDQDSLISYGGCGIPYYISGDVADESALRSTSFHVLRDQYYFEKYKGVKVRILTQALSIDRAKKQLLIKDLGSGAEETLDYDKLVLATGSQPYVLPIPGAELDGVFTIANLHKAIEIKDRIAKGKVGKAVVIGGGAIGIEMAEALTDLWGVETSLIEFKDQLLPGVIEWSLSAMMCKHLRDSNVSIYLGESASEIVGEGGRVTAVRTPQRVLDADLVIMATGVRAQSEIARAAGLRVSDMGGIVVNRRMQTSDPSIYAAGDCVKIPNLITGKYFYAPFGSLANKEGRVVGDNLAGLPSTFDGAVGSFIMKAFDVCIGATGLSLEMARAEGFDADFSLTAPADRAHFYPTQEIICCVMIFDRRTRKVLGVQAFGAMNDNVSARINAAAAFLSKGATIDDFTNLEMAYAPPFSAAVDTVNAAAYVADNLCDNRLRQITMEEFYSWMDDFSTQPDWISLDVRHEQQALPFVEKFGADRWISMPDDRIRERYEELPKDKTLIIFCNAGSRSYEIQVFLDSAGVTNNRVLCGGFNVIKRIGAPWLP
ncbi:FAD-dependent oxidoreductase [Desulfopila inferna]|uniref:FAD-dependent oxidoreductase n=1 Tax=Desulfopila inferna TaxID=468528 RepID=UPI001963B475|nr:FAD-dependent oxidoreductase [Desulfopila inferna]MBM9604400.1 FAD-dependent oxidoreductase [Desulfopila inferna]